MNKVLEYVHIIPSEAFDYINPHTIFDKITQHQKANGENVRVLTGLSNQNLQKIAIAFAKMSQNVAIDADFKDLLQKLLHKKLELLRKNKGKLRMSLDELHSFDIIINSALCSNEPEGTFTPEYLEFYTLFLNHLHVHYQAYAVNEDVVGLLKTIYLADSEYFLEAKRRSKEDMDTIASDILIQHPTILSTCFKPKIYNKIPTEVNENKELTAGNVKKFDERFSNDEFDEEEFFELLEGIFSNLPNNKYKRNIIIDQLEASACKRFDRIKPHLIFKTIQLFYDKLGGVSFTTLTRLEEQFLNGHIADINPKQITQLMKIAHSSD